MVSVNPRYRCLLSSLSIVSQKRVNASSRVYPCCVILLDHDVFFIHMFFFCFEQIQINIRRGHVHVRHEPGIMLNTGYSNQIHIQPYPIRLLSYLHNRKELCTSPTNASKAECLISDSNVSIRTTQAIFYPFSRRCLAIYQAKSPSDEYPTI